MSLLRRPFLLLPLLFGLSVPLGDAGGAVRVTPDGGVPFTLLEVATAEGARWYDAEGWLRHLPGTAEWDGIGARLTYREGKLQGVLLPTAPYAIKSGAPLGDAPPTRVVDGRLAVSERFLVERSSDFLGRRISVELVHGTGALRVVLDPGHGGADKGSTAPGAPSEKDAVLQLAQDTAARLRKRGFDARLTREDGRGVALSERAALANRLQADLFLSLHASGAARPQARGYELFLQQGAKAPRDEALWASGQTPWAPQSRRWAEVVRAEVGRTLGSLDRGLQEIPSPLMEAVASPACALEVGNLSWPEDAETFTKAPQRAALAEALARAAEAYFRNIP